MGEQTEQPRLRRGHFPLRISVTDRTGEKARELAARFIGRISERYDLQVLLQPTAEGEAVIAVPFPDKEGVRVDFNIFASEAEDECGDPCRYYFYMESAYETHSPQKGR